MIISITKKIELSDQDNMILRKARKIMVNLSDVLDDDFYIDLANRIEDVYLHEPWEIEIEDEKEGL